MNVFVLLNTKEDILKNVGNRAVLGHHSIEYIFFQRILCHSSSFALVPVGVVNLASCMCVKSEEEGPGDKNPLQYFEFGLQYLVQPVNPTYRFDVLYCLIKKENRKKDSRYALQSPDLNQMICAPKSRSKSNYYTALKWPASPQNTCQVETLCILIEFVA